MGWQPEMEEGPQAASVDLKNERTPDRQGKQRQRQIRRSLAAAEELRCQSLVT